MPYSVNDIKNDLAGVIHGTTVNKITGLFPLFDRAARQFLLDTEAQETIRVVQLANPIYNQVYDYACPTDLNGNGIIDIRPQVNRNPSDVIGQTFDAEFDLWKNWTWNNTGTIQWNGAVRTLRLSLPTIPAGVTLNTCDGVTGNGTWITGGGASNLQTDNTYYAAGSGSISFDLDVSGSGYVENSTMEALDLTDYENQSQMFWFNYLPTGTNFTSVTLRWGSDSSNYWEQTVTSDFNSNIWVDGWNQNGALWLGAIQVGNPDITQVAYVRCAFVYTGAQTAVRLDSIVDRKGVILEMVYYSKYLFRDSLTGAFQERATDNSNLINLDTASQNLYFDIVALFTVQQLYDAGANFDIAFFTDQYQQSKTRYKNLHPSERIPQQTPYYRRTDRPYDSFFNWRW